MKHKWLLLHIAFIVLISTANCWAQSISENGRKKIDDYLIKKTSTAYVPGIVVMVANKKKIIYQNSFGFNSIGKKDSMKIDAIFNIASMTKAITSVVIMQLHEQGKLSFDDPAAKYLPEINKMKMIDSFNLSDSSYSVKPVPGTITIERLLTHTSGIGYPFCNDTLAMINQKQYHGQLFTPYDSFPLLHAPGLKWAYGMNYEILGKIIEKITGLSLDNYYDEDIFKPLGMKDTYYKVPESKYNRTVNYYAHVNNKYIEQPGLAKQPPVVLGSAGLFSTAKDYTLFLQMLLNGGTLNGKKILSKKSVEKMTSNQIGNLMVETQHSAMPQISNDFPLRTGIDKFGYGFVITSHIDNNPSKRKPGSYGWAGVFNTYYWVDPVSKITVVILMQVLPFYDYSCINALNGLEQLLYENLQ